MTFMLSANHAVLPSLKPNDSCLTRSRSPRPLTLVAITSREVRCWSVTRRVFNYSEDCAYVNGFPFLTAGFYHAKDTYSNMFSGEEDQLWTYGYLGCEPRVAESRRPIDLEGERASATTFNYNLTFALQLRKMAENLIRVSRKLLATVPSVDWVTFCLLRQALPGLLISSCFRLRPQGDLGQPLIRTSTFQVAGLGVPRTS